MPDAAPAGPDPEALAVLEAEGLLSREGGAYRPTRRFRGAMMRAALRLMQVGDAGDDLRVPIATALVELVGDRHSEEQLSRLVVAMVPIQVGELPGASRRE